MFKKIAIVFVFIFITAGLGSCRSKKSSCDYSKINTQENIDKTSSDDVFACID
jgi:hypothetical protein